MMNVSRLTLVFVGVHLLMGLCSAFKELLEEKPDDEPEPKRGFFGIFHRPYQQDNAKQSGFNIGGHFGSALTGGTLGFQVELNPLKKVHDVIGIAKQFVPKIPGGFGLPHSRPEKPHEIPPSETDKDAWEPEDHEKSKPDDPKWEDIGEKPKPEDPKWENIEEKPKPENPDWDNIDESDPLVPKPDQPSWDDIGEDSDYVTVPIEDIIQPRVKPRSRPKRFIESKIYHVPLIFSSNAKPYKVNIGLQHLLTKGAKKEDTR